MEGFIGTEHSWELEALRTDGDMGTLHRLSLRGAQPSRIGGTSGPKEGSRCMVHYVGCKAYRVGLRAHDVGVVVNTTLKSLDLTLLERPKAESASNTMSSCQPTSLIPTPDVRLFLK